ncbi:MAG: ImmA/IrrE family metallo-endopeptidase [Candidatus Saccharibacteria bacterium]|nr:ImmA/IrrE family metallo-endopeptidase [Candidatus Saccharibacteria bacterium]
MSWRQDINFSNLKIARENIDLSTQEATHKINPKTKKDKVALWEAGNITDKSPSYKQLEKLADIYNISPFHLLMKENLEISKTIPAYRSTKIEEGYYLKRFISLLKTRQNIIRYNMLLDKTSSNNLVGSGRNYKDAESLAKFIISKIGYRIKDLNNKKALAHLRELLEKQYIFVFKNTVLRNEKIDLAEMRGIYINDQYAPLIALNREDSSTGQLFTLAHELVHLFRAEDSLDSIDFRQFDQIKDKEEIFCNQVAAHFLMPKSEIPQLVYENVEGIKDLAKKFQVSSLACFYRLKDLKKINYSDLNGLENFFKSEIQQNLENKKSFRGSDRRGFSPHASIKSGNGSLFNEYIFSLHLDNRLSASETQKLLRLPLGSF